MSHRTYNEKWHEAQKLLATAIQLEIPQLDRRQHRPQLAELYLRYIVIANKLTDCVDQIVQPQKKKFIRRLLELILGRVLELKTDLVESDLCEYTYCGDTITSLNLTPEYIELKIPNCFKYERKAELSSRKAFIDSVLEKLGYLEKPKEQEKLTSKQAILLIQSHERARQGRLRAQFMKEIKLLKDKSKPGLAEEQSVEESAKISLIAALCIQKIWRGYITRRMTRKKKIEEMLLIGMLPPPYVHSTEIDNAEIVWENRRKLQELREREYLLAIEEFKDKIQKTQRGPMLEQLSDQVRGWLYEYKQQTGKIPEYTGSERSASRLMLSRQGTDSELSKSTGTEKSSRDSKGKKTKSDKEKDGKVCDEEEEEDTKAIASTFLTEITTKNEEYEEHWKNKDESSNFQQRHYEDIIINEQMVSLENELRKVVDEMMGAELQMLQDALDKDRGYKGKKPKKPSKKSRRGGKKSKKKKEKDLTPDRTTESLFEEMVANGIIRKYGTFKKGIKGIETYSLRYPAVYLKDFIGEKSHWNHSPFNSGKEQPIAIGDLRQLVTEFCILPLSSPFLRESSPFVRSLLLAGSHGCGKDMLVHAICTEAGAMLFDLTPANIVGKYPGKSGLTMLLHLVNKVSRLLQPAVIYMETAEKPYMKKTAKGDKTDPKRLKKDLPKFVKGICPEDQIMLIGVSHSPWEADQKLLQQVYQKYLRIPKPDYSTRYAVWQKLLGQYKAIGWQFDISAMSKISDGFTIGSIAKCVEDVMTCKRMLQLRVHPLNPAELINSLSTQTPIYREEEDAMGLWWTRTPMVRRRLKAIETAENEIEEAKESRAKK